MSVSSESVNCLIKTPKRVLHFSDGVIECDEEEGIGCEDNSQKPMNEKQNDSEPKSWPTVSYVRDSVFWFGSKALEVCDYLGEGLANFFGITSPKYETEINEYMKQIEDQKSLELKQRTEFCGWNPNIGFNENNSKNNTFVDLKDINSDKQRI